MNMERLSSMFEMGSVWFERGSWFVLIVGVIGVVANTLGTISLQFSVDLTNDLNVRAWLLTLGDGLFDLAIVVALFLLIRLLIVGVPALLETRDENTADE